MLLQNKVAIVTGGARGIGYAVARRLLNDGAKVVIADIEDDLVEKAAGELSPLGDVLPIVCDVGERLDVRNLIAATLDAHGQIDVLVNNAGIVHGADFLEVEEEDFDRVLRVNLKGAFLVAQAVARHMVERVEAGAAPGSIINMSSINAVFALPNQVPYSISKGGISQLTKAAAISLAPYGIRVNAVGPGSIATEMLKKVAREDPNANRTMLSRTPLGRLGDPSEIAAVVAFLASEDASYVTGQTIYADGGRLPLNYLVPVED
ncbi:SDR family NAD(P)-dependent oxidoreductase [Amorphus orientalis]|uniref:NAD(P)-dependent dehydrogenase (Short-subunit alcohol dehydrogenase family) n=1 Tax=Amorphus orientalis TaxID=649198 RepID=A0AAE4AQM2_9HYPH|nr:SDR family NAD(P)-dependent oxidoreductase [Amorphus orientalis]MDQ0314246.1 NAD(P)-dependent dehydrogenase (short-subunit alcohol dehydrogenase family) [Amorphus orientalis]